MPKLLLLLGRVMDIIDTTRKAFPYQREHVHGQCSPTMMKNGRQKALKQRKQSTERLAVPKVQPAKHLSDLSFTDVRFPLEKVTFRVEGGVHKEALCCLKCGQ